MVTLNKSGPYSRAVSWKLQSQQIGLCSIGIQNISIVQIGDVVDVNAKDVNEWLKSQLTQARRTVRLNWTSQVESSWTGRKTRRLHHLFSCVSPLQGLLQNNGSCVPPEQCGCVHLQHRTPGRPPTPVSVPQGSTVTIGCSTWLDSGCWKYPQCSREPIRLHLHQSSLLHQQFDCLLFVLCLNLFRCLSVWGLWLSLTYSYLLSGCSALQSLPWWNFGVWHARVWR